MTIAQLDTATPATGWSNFEGEGPETDNTTPKAPPSPPPPTNLRMPSFINRLNPAEAWRNRDVSDFAVRRRKIRCWILFIVILLVSIGLIIASLKKVPSTEMGVQYNVHKKQLDEASKSGGLFAGPPGFRFIKFPSTYITVDLLDRTCVSNDGLLVKFSVKFQYQMTAANVLPAILKYRDFDKCE